MKRYNPFKMWGSYIGALLVIIYPYIFHLSCSIGMGGDILTLKPLMPCLLFVQFQFFTVIIGFLLGWGIHSLFRRLRK